MCDRTNWEIHAAKHPEIAGREEWVQETINGPDAIHQSSAYASRHLFHKEYDFGSELGRAYLRVIVAYNEGGLLGQMTGAVVSAFAVPGPKRDDVQIWPVV